VFSDDALDSARDGLWISVPVHLDIVIDCHSAETGAPEAINYSREPLRVLSQFG
jgi:hypothetical protein